MSKLIRQGDANLASFGQFGYTLLATGQSSTSGKTVVAIQSLDDTTEVTTTTTDTSLWPNFSEDIISTGVTIFGNWSSVSIDGDTGRAIVYYA